MLNDANLLQEIPKAAWSPPECWRHLKVPTQSFVGMTKASNELRAFCEMPGETKEAQGLTDLTNTHTATVAKY